MSVERVSGSSSLIDVLDRILDKGVVVDAWARISLSEINLAGREARMVVASMDVEQKLAVPAGSAGVDRHPAPVESEAAEAAPARARSGNRSLRGGRKRGDG